MFDGLLSAIQNFFNWILNTFNGFFEFLRSIVDWFITAVRNIGQWIGDIVRFIVELFTAIVSAINEVVTILILLVQIAVALIQTLGTWLFEAVNMIVAVLNEFFTVTATPVPGLPQCISSPTSHDLCGIVYMLDNTIWSGSVGALIVTLILIIIDVSIVFFFARKILAFLRLGEAITNVN